MSSSAWPSPLSPSPRPPASHPGPRQRRGRSKARAPVARKPCLLAPPRAGDRGQNPRDVAVGPWPRWAFP
ncbi:hypothetical protein D9R12_07745 [Pseudoxanthomonas spadix]|nr:hypothetical protein D9R12_07745 [Pseudoxanthomonas spadix]